MRTVTAAAMALAASVFAPATPASAQTDVDFARRPSWLIGYVANAPDQMLGLGAATVLPALNAWGFHANVKITHDSPARETFLRNLSPADAEDSGDLFHRRRNAWTTINAAAVRAISYETAFYFGGGYSTRTVYAEYLDETFERSQTGRYWVEDREGALNTINLVGGVFWRMGQRLVFQFGGETAPAGFTVGGHVLVR